MSTVIGILMTLGYLTLSCRLFATFMRPFILIISIFFLLACSSNAQQVYKTFSFNEVGWTIDLPHNFQVLDSITDVEKMQGGKKLIENANGIKAEVSRTKTLISATKNSFNFFNSTITPCDINSDSGYQRETKTVKDMIYKTLVETMPKAKIDSATSTENIDGLSFDKFRITVTINGNVLFNSFLLSKLYKGYDFGIS